MSKAVANFNFKAIDDKARRSSDVGIQTTLKKKFDDTTLSFIFTDASLKDLKSGKGVVIGAEQKVGDGVKAELKYDVAKKAATAALTVDRKISGNDLQLKAVYQQAGDVFLLEESWKFDKNNKLAGTYNFKTEAATFTYTHIRGPWTLEGKYDFAKDAPTASIKKKQGKHTLQAIYAIKDETATLSWEKKPFKLTARSKANQKGVSGVNLTLQATKEFEF